MNDASHHAPDTVAEGFASLVANYGPAEARTLAGLFVTSAEKILAALESSVASGDVKTQQRSVHTLRSSAALVGASSLASVCGNYENRLAQGDLVLTTDDVLTIRDEADPAIDEVRALAR